MFTIDKVNYYGLEKKKKKKKRGKRGEENIDVQTKQSLSYGQVGELYGLLYKRLKSNFY